mmetsp:Transcript_44179/g.99843  ORF Transcript_44179/g.99843 Transcript_44179/m.99843 type:complete len:348 (-) Transcript_44179:874-1917(-)
MGREPPPSSARPRGPTPRLAAARRGGAGGCEARGRGGGGRGGEPLLFRGLYRADPPQPRHRARRGGAGGGAGPSGGERARPDAAFSDARALGGAMGRSLHWAAGLGRPGPARGRVCLALVRAALRRICGGPLVERGPGRGAPGLPRPARTRLPRPTRQQGSSGQPSRSGDRRRPRSPGLWRGPWRGRGKALRQTGSQARGQGGGGQATADGQGVAGLPRRELFLDGQGVHRRPNRVGSRLRRGQARGHFAFHQKGRRRRGEGPRAPHHGGLHVRPVDSVPHALGGGAEGGSDGGRHSGWDPELRRALLRVRALPRPLFDHVRCLRARPLRPGARRPAASDTWRRRAS